MKIYINGRFLTQSITGVQRYAHEVIKHLDELLERNEIPHTHSIEIVAPQNIVYDFSFKNIKLKKVGHLTGHLWEQLELPFYARRGLLVNFCNTAPIFKRKQIVTIHDASIYLKDNNFSTLFKTWYKILYAAEMKTADVILTVSQFSRDELIKFTGVGTKKIKVVYEGQEHIKGKKADNRILTKYDLKSEAYVLAVSSMDPRKNFKSLVYALEKIKNMNINVVIAGGTNPRVFSKQGFEFPKNVKYLGYVTDEELRALYIHAYCFVYPSLYEGFGLPPLEAMTLGCPVIVSNRASLPEVCGDASLYCDPVNPDDIAKKIELLLKDKQLRNNYKERGFERASHFTWDQCAISIWKIISETV